MADPLPYSLPRSDFLIGGLTALGTGVIAAACSNDAPRSARATTATSTSQLPATSKGAPAASSPFGPSDAGAAFKKIRSVSNPASFYPGFGHEVTTLKPLLRPIPQGRPQRLGRLPSWSSMDF
jgi:hypothetical protein